MGLLIRWLMSALALLIVTWLVPGFSYDSIVAIAIAALILGLLNVIVRPILVLLTLPITVLTLGLFLIVINALMLEATSWLVPGFEIRHFGWAIVGAVVLSLVTLITDRIGRAPAKRRKKERKR